MRTPVAYVVVVGGTVAVGRRVAGVGDEAWEQLGRATGELLPVARELVDGQSSDTRSLCRDCRCPVSATYNEYTIRKCQS